MSSWTSGYVKNVEAMVKSNQRGSAEGIAVILSFIFMTSIIAGVLFGWPLYKRWTAGVAGQAELARAEANRQITVLEAKQKMEAAEYLNKAEIKRAEGVAKANKIIADGLGGPEGYLRYLWIQGLESDKPQIIYIPTEGGMPILEAGRRR